MMTTETNHQQTKADLEYIQEAYSDPNRKVLERKQILEKMIDISHIGYIPAMEFFFVGLDDPDWSWRLEHLGALGYHYKIENESKFSKKIGELLLHDPSELVRMSAATVMSRFAVWPDRNLISALTHDRDYDVRKAAFDALLLLLGVPMIDIQKIQRDMMNIDLGSSIDALRLIAQRMNKPLV